MKISAAHSSLTIKTTSTFIETYSMPQEAIITIRDSFIVIIITIITMTMFMVLST